MHKHIGEKEKENNQNFTKKNNVWIKKKKFLNRWQSASTTSQHLLSIQKWQKIQICINTNVNKRRCEFKYFEKCKHFKHIMFVFLISAFDGRSLSFPASYHKLWVKRKVWNRQRKCNVMHPWAMRHLTYLLMTLNLMSLINKKQHCSTVVTAVPTG